MVTLVENGLDSAFSGYDGSLKKSLDITDAILAEIGDELLLGKKRGHLRLEMIKALRAAYKRGFIAARGDTPNVTEYVQI